MDLDLKQDLYDDLHKQLARLKSYKIEAEEREKLMKQELQQVKKIAASQEKDFQQLKKELEKANTIVKKSKDPNALISLTEQNMDLQRDVTDLRTQNENYEQKIASSTTLIDQLHREIRRLKDELIAGETTRKIEELTNTTPSENSSHHNTNNTTNQIESLCQQISTLEVSVKDKTYQINRLREEMEELKTNQNDEIVKFQKLIHEKQSQLNSSQEAHKKYESFAKDKIELLQSDIAALLEEKLSLTTKFANAESEIENQKKRFESLKSQHLILIKDLNSASQAEKNGSKLEKDCNDLKTQITSLEEDKKDLSRELTLAKVQQLHLETSISKTSEEIQNKETQIISLKSEIDLLKSKIEDLTEKLSLSESNSSNEIIKAIKMEIEAKNFVIFQKNKVIEDMNEFRDQKLAEIDQLKMEINNIKNENERKIGVLTSELKSSEANNQLIEDFKTQIKNLEKTIQTMKENEKKEELERNEAQLRLIEESKEPLLNEIKLLKSQIENLKLENVSTIAEFEQKILEHENMDKRQARVIKELRQELKKVTPQHLDPTQSPSKAPHSHEMEESDLMAKKLKESEELVQSLNERIEILEENVRSLTVDLLEKNESVGERKLQTSSEYSEPENLLQKSIHKMKIADVKGEATAVFRSASKLLNVGSSRSKLDPF